MRALLPIAALWACNPAPPAPDEGVDYRVGDNEVGETSSGERGSIKMSEVLWSGSVGPDGVRDQSDVFIELRNESARAALDALEERERMILQLRFGLRGEEPMTLEEIGEYCLRDVRATAELFQKLQGTLLPLFKGGG